MFEPAVLYDWTHLLVHDHILQILQGGMLAYFFLERQHVLANCTCGGGIKATGWKALHRDQVK